MLSTSPKANPTKIHLLNPEQENEGSFQQKFFFWLICALIGMIFILLDRIESGKMDYVYVNLTENLTTTNSNTFRCGFKTITLHCPSTDTNSTNICNMLTINNINEIKEEKTKNKIHIPTSYDKLYSHLYYSFTCIGIAIPWIISTAVFFSEPNYGNKKWLGTTSQTKCFIFCLLSTFASIIAIIFGILLVINNDCSDGLYEYIIDSLGENIQYYPNLNKNNISVWLGATLIFIMINIGITFIFAVYCGNGAKHHEALKNNLRNKCFSFKVKLKSKCCPKKEHTHFPFESHPHTHHHYHEIIVPPVRGLTPLSPCDEKVTKA
eukprot:150893_1